MARAGLSEIITEFRNLVQESGTAIFTDDNIQTILDSCKTPLYEYPVISKEEFTTNGTVYTRYVTPNHTTLEGTATGVSSVRLTNSVGSVITGYTQNVLTGEFSFDTDVDEQTFFYSGNSYDLNEAVAKGWRRKAAYYSTSFDFQVEGRSFKKSQVVTNCLNMAKYYESQQASFVGNIYRSDYK